MDARICANPQCLSVMPAFTCTICNTPTEPLPRISLALIGVDATARLTHTSPHGYFILIAAPSGYHNVNISLTDLLRSAQPQLPHINEVTGLMIMDSLSTASVFIRTKNAGHWSGWVLYLLDLLQDHTDTVTFQEVLRDLQQDIATKILEPEERMPADDIVEHIKNTWPRLANDTPPERP